MTVKRNKKFKEHLIQQLQNQQQRMICQFTCVPSMCFSSYMAILMEASNKGIQEYILLKMCICEVKNIIFKLKLLKIFKIQTNYKYFSCKYFTFDVSICHYKPCDVGAWLYHGGRPSTQSSAISHEVWNIYMKSICN